MGFLDPSLEEKPTRAPYHSAALILLAACDVDNDTANERVTVTYDKERIKRSAEDAGRVARDVAAGVVNVAGSTKQAIEKEVGDVDVDVKVTRDRSGQASGE